MKRLMILILLLLPLQYGKGQNLEQFFRTYHKEQGVDAIHIGNITMKLAGLFTETLGVNCIEILDLGEATETLRQRFQDEGKSFKDPEFETLLTENDKEDHTKILVKIKDEMIRELVRRFLYDVCSGLGVMRSESGLRYDVTRDGDL